MTPEGKIEAYLKRRVRETGGRIRKVKWLDRSGAPDRLVWWRFPTAAFVEVKRPGVTLDPMSLQSREVTLLRETGWPVFVVSSDEEVEDFITAMAKKVLTT